MSSGGPGWSQADEFPIGAWFPGLFQADSTRWAARLNSVVADSFNTIHASMSGYQHRSNVTAAENAGWMRLADSRDLNIQLHSWWQPPGWRSHSANYWSRTLEAEHTRFRHHTGNVTADGRYAKAATTDSPGDSPGLLLDTPIQANPPAELKLRMLTRPQLDRNGNQVRDRNGNAIIDTV